FRRRLCRSRGEDVEAGLLPADMTLLGGMVRDIAYRNAAAFFGMPPGDA
ncbi:MAG: glucuronate isomerase, partial [Planctomycetota bacterium]